MVDRQELRETAKSAGESIAGTFKRAGKKAADAGKEAAKTTKQGAKNIKQDITGAGDQGEVDVIYSPEAETYYVLGPDNDTLGQYDDEMKAKAAARELKREIADSEDAKSGFKDKATSAAQRLGESLSGAAQSLDDADLGGDGDGNGLGGGGMMADSGGDPQLPGGEMGGGGSPNVPMTGGDGPASTLPGGMGNGAAEPGVPFLAGDDEPASTLPGGMGNGAAEPGVPFLAGDDDGTGPMVPDFAPSGGSDEMPQLPGMSQAGGQNGEDVMLPGFGGMASDDESGDEQGQAYPWMF